MQKRHADAQSEARKRMKAANLAVARISDLAEEVDHLTDNLARVYSAADVMVRLDAPGKFNDLLTRIREVGTAVDALNSTTIEHMKRLDAAGKAATDRVKFLDDAAVPPVFICSRDRMGDAPAPPRSWFAADDMPEYMRLAIERYEAEKRTAAAEEERKRESARREDMAIYNSRLYNARQRVKAGVASECEKAMVANEDGVAAVYGAEKSGDK